MHNNIKRIASIMIAAMVFVSLPCGSIFARTHIETDKDCSITVDIPDTWNDLDTVDFTVDLYRVAEVDKNGTYAVTDDYKELSGMVESIDSKTTADDYEKMAKSASEIVDKEGLSADKTTEEKRKGVCVRSKDRIVSGIYQACQFSTIWIFICTISCFGAK